MNLSTGAVTKVQHQSCSGRSSRLRCNLDWLAGPWGSGEGPNAAVSGAS